MKVYRICQPVYTPSPPGHFRLHFVTADLVQTYSAEQAIRLAKSLGHLNPIVELIRERLQ